MSTHEVLTFASCKTILIEALTDYLTGDINLEY